MTNINKGTRFTNFSTDYLIVFLVWLFLSAGSGGVLFEPFIFYSILFSYYFTFEVIRGQTLGKMITNTRVVSKDGTPAGCFKILARSLLRLVPIDIVSYLFGTELGFHDILSGTRLMKIELHHTVDNDG